MQKATDFFNRGDVSRTDPSFASVSLKTQEPKRVMEITLKAAHQVFEEEANTTISFSRFAKLRPKMTKTVKHTKINTCCCEYCANVTLKQEAINSFLSSKAHRELMLPNKYELRNATLCEKEQGQVHHQKTCLDRKCSNCGVEAIRTKLQPVLDESSDTLVTWKTWAIVQQEIHNRAGVAKKTSKRMLTSKTGPFDQLLTELEEDLATFAYHLGNAEWQHKMFSSLKEHLPNDWLLQVMEFAENFGCFYQDEAQGAHWTRDSVTIHPVVSYYRCPDDGDIVTESFVFISDDLNHDAHAVHHFQVMAVNALKARGMIFTKVIQFSDGCGAQYKGRTNFVDVSHAAEDTGVPKEKHFFGSQHGKGPCDAEIGVVKRMVSSAVKARRAVVSNANELFHYCQASLTRPPTPDVDCHNRRTFIFVSRNGDVNRNRPDRVGPDIKYADGTRSLHSVRGMLPYVITTRERSCFCPACTSEEGDCANEDFCGTWAVHHMKKQQRRRRAGKLTIFILYQIHTENRMWRPKRQGI